MTDQDPTPEPPARPDAIDSPPPSGDDPLASLLDGLDMDALLSMAGDVHQQMEQAQERAAATQVTGSSGGGAVHITLTGAMECTDVTIAPEATEDVEMLQDLVQSALRDALGQARAIGGDDPFGGLGDQLGGLLGG